MPLTPIFGSEFSWALRDAIEYSGPYDNIYKKNFGNVADDERGRNKIGVSIKSIAGGAQESLRLYCLSCDFMYSI